MHHYYAFELFKSPKKLIDLKTKLIGYYVRYFKHCQHFEANYEKFLTYVVNEDRSPVYMHVYLQNE